MKFFARILIRLCFLVSALFFSYFISSVNLWTFFLVSFLLMISMMPFPLVSSIGTPFFNFFLQSIEAIQSKPKWPLLRALMPFFLGIVAINIAFIYEGILSLWVSLWFFLILSCETYQNKYVRLILYATSIVCSLLGNLALGFYFHFHG